MSQALAAVKDSPGAIMESVIVKGDLAKLTPEERTKYYMEVCKSVGLNPLTRPLEYITLNGKLTLYARRDAADQLRKINNISLEIVKRSIAEDLFTVHVRAKDAAGRTDEDFGVVTIGVLKGEARANAILKGVTKAKRRVTLSICGLGFLDETEIEDIPAANKGAPAPAPTAIAPPKSEPPHDPATGEIKPHLIPVPVAADGERSDYLTWGRQLIAAVLSASNLDEGNEWVLLNNAAIANCAEHAKKAHGSIEKAIAAMRAKFASAEDADLLNEAGTTTVLSGG